MEDPNDHCGLLVSIVDFKNNLCVEFVFTYTFDLQDLLYCAEVQQCNLKKMPCISVVAVALLCKESLKKEFN